MNKTYNAGIVIIFIFIIYGCDWSYEKEIQHYDVRMGCCLTSRMSATEARHTRDWNCSKGTCKTC